MIDAKADLIEPQVHFHPRAQPLRGILAWLWFTRGKPAYFQSPKLKPSICKKSFAHRSRNERRRGFLIVGEQLTSPQKHWEDAPRHRQ